MLILFLRAIFLYTLVFVVMRLMGKRQVSDLQPFDLVVTLLIADLASDPITDTGIPLIYGIMPIFALYLMQQLMSWLSLKSERVRGILSGKPIIVVVKGVVQEDAMRKGCYTLNDLLEQLRTKDVFHISEVEYAIIETDGSLSVLKKGKFQQPSMQDMNIKAPKVALPDLLILDGKVHERALQKSGHTGEWLTAQLKTMGFQTEKEVFFLSYDAATGTLNAQERVGKQKRPPG